LLDHIRTPISPELEKLIIHFAEENPSLLFPPQGFDPVNCEGDIKCKSTLGGVLKYYYRKAA